jgi:hypothetical protein
MGCEKTDVLLHKLTQKLGLPLDEVVAKGQLPKNIAAKMAQNCKTCAAPMRCESFLATQPDTITAPPSFCVNCRLLTFLSKSLPDKR